MPQIPGLPVDEPVAGPQAHPGIFGAVGGAIEGMGQEVEQMAAGNQQFEQHLIEAQRYLKAKQAEIAYDTTLNQVHADLAKTTTPEDAQKVYDHAKGQLAGVLQPFETDRVLSRQLAIFGAEQDVQLQNTVNGRKATLIQKGDEQANDLLYKKSLEEGINTGIANGDPSVARNQLKAKLDASVHVMGTMTPQQAESIMDQWDTDWEKGTIEAYTNSPSPATRKQNIKNLETGNVPHIDKATQNALLTKAKSRDRELTNLAESQDYNGAVNKFDDLTKGWAYEDKVKALQDGQFLKDNGFVDENGQPDRKKADMLLEEADRQESRQRRIQTDKDNEVIDKYVDQADSGKMSDAKIDEVVRQDGGSPKASATLRSVLRQHLRDARTEAREARVEANQSRRDTAIAGQATSADLYRKIATGESIDPVTDVWDQVDAGNMTVAQAKAVQSAYQKGHREDLKSNLDKINHSSLDKGTQGKLSEELTNAVNQQNLQGKAMSDFTDKLIQEHAEKVTTNWINTFISNITHGPAGASSTPIAAAPKPTTDSTPTNANQNYDVAGYEKEHGAGSYQAQLGKGHFPDTYKLPSHITFSDDSKYSKPGQEGGQWRQINNKWYFTPSAFNLKQHSIQEYMNYFDKEEGKSTLRVRKDGKLYDYIGHDKWQPAH